MQYPLQLYIVWHPSQKEDIINDPCFYLAKTIFSSFSRNTAEPIERGIGIPTYFLSDSTSILPNIQWDAAQKTIVVWLITDDMLLSKGDWENQIEQILAKDKDKLVIPVAMTNNFALFSKKTEKLKWIILDEKKDLEEKKDLLINKLALDLLEELHPTTNECLTLFISHTKVDGQELVNEVEKVIYRDKLKVKTYTEIPYFGDGGSFEETLTQSIEESIFLIINTNLYNEEDYCLKTLLRAKEYNRPVVLLNAQYKVTFRGWPYLGNVPTIQMPTEWIKKKEERPLLDIVSEEKEQFFEEIVHYIFLEALRCVYQQQFLKMLIKGIKKEAIPFPVAPELLTLHQKNITKDQWVLYPDPPLSNTEIKLLNQYFDTPIITPALYPLVSTKVTAAQAISNEKETVYKIMLDDCIVGFSISEPLYTVAGCYQGMSRWHLQDALVELTRYLFVCGVTCAYGGGLDYQVPTFNFSTTLIELSRAYKNITSSKKVKNYFVGTQKNPNAYLTHMDVVDFIPLTLGETIEKAGLDYQARHALELTYIRQQTFKIYNDAQIFIAGKLYGYDGILPGVLEEAYWALKENCPIYIIGAFGGVSGALAELFLTGKSTALKNAIEEEQQVSTWQDLRQNYIKVAAESLKWKEDPAELNKRICYQDLKLFFLRQRSKKENNYLNNGLSKEENEQLFKTKNILKISSLVLKGLHNHFNLFK